jgi:predicted CXXCH cytochrome family protein
MGISQDNSIPWIAGLIACCVMSGTTVMAANPVAAGDDARFVGGQSCGVCHEKVYRDWTDSHHDLAMQEATKETVLGNFDDTIFTAYGVTSRFFKKDGGFYVRTEGSDGALRDYKIEYTFGVHPLQQYLIAFPGGRYQALSLAWDTRPEAQGGQRWFHLYPDEHIAPGDVLHWTQINQNWNYMCADCHSTNVRRNFDLANDRYETTWLEIDVSCEACHGPGSKHVAWAESRTAATASREAQNGLGFAFNERKGVRWWLKEGADTATLSTPPAKFRTEIETCGRCHARRSPLGDAIEHGKPVLDSYRVALLTEDLYHADGQMKDEVYVYGSFLQSKMYQAGVTCSDCHDPHSLKLRAKGNDLCTRCHRSDTFDTPGHHFHVAGQPGSRCVDCHAPEKTYMVVDPRRDHSFRVPRADLSVKLGVPNACSDCHINETAQWAADRIAERHGPGRRQSPHFSEAIAASRAGEPAAQRQLVRIALDDSQPAIVRATALETIGRHVDRDSFAAMQQGLRDENPLVRLAALGAMERFGLRERFRFVFPFLEDPVRALRLESARLLAPVPLEALPTESRKSLENAFADFERTHKANADRPEWLMTLANFYRDRGDNGHAEATYQQAMARHPWFGPAFVNLADFYRSLGRDRQGEATLLAALNTVPEQADIYHAYGLLLVRNHRYAEATKHLQRAAEQQPDNARYNYVYALALHKTGNTEGAISTLIAAHARHLNNREILFALTTMSRDTGDLKSAERYARAQQQ